MSADAPIATIHILPRAIARGYDISPLQGSLLHVLRKQIVYERIEGTSINFRDDGLIGEGGSYIAMIFPPWRQFDLLCGKLFIGDHA